MNINEKRKQKCSGNEETITAHCILHETRFTGKLIINDSQCNKENKSTDLLSISEVRYMALYILYNL